MVKITHSRLPVFCKLFAILMLIVTSYFTPSIAQSKSVPVLLTFDAEDDRDALAIREMNISENATYFFTGQFVEQHGQLVSELSTSNTVGSHSYSHPHLPKLDETELRKELSFRIICCYEVQRGYDTISTLFLP